MTTPIWTWQNTYVQWVLFIGLIQMTTLIYFKKLSINFIFRCQLVMYIACQRMLQNTSRVFHLPIICVRTASRAEADKAFVNNKNLGTLRCFVVIFSSKNGGLML